MNYLPHCLAGMLAMTLSGWTGVGESSDPQLSVRELPLGLIDCAPQPACMQADDIAVQWLTHTPRGELFLINRDCDGDGCGRWVVEKRLTETITLLQFSGSFRVAPAANAYPDIVVREPTGAAQILRTRYQWQAGRYAATATEPLFVVDGVECGTASECNDKAYQMVGDGRAAQAMRIWELVHQLEWI